MVRRIRSVIICIMMAAAMLLCTAAACAADSTITIEADNAEAKPGDVITFTIKLSPVEHFGTMQMKLVIPDGLTYLQGSGKLADGLVNTLGFDNASFVESSGIINGSSLERDYSSTQETVIAVFQCTVDQDHDGGELEVGLTKLQFYSVEQSVDHTSEYSVGSAVIKVAGAGDPVQDPNTNAGENTPPADNTNTGENTPPADNTNTGENTPPADNTNTGENTPPADDPNTGENTPPADNTNAGENTPTADNTDTGENTPPADNTNTGENTAPAQDPDSGENSAPDKGSEGSQTPSDAPNTNVADNSSSGDKNGSEGQNKGSEGQSGSAPVNTNSADGVQEQQNTEKGFLSRWYVPVIAVVVIALSVFAAKRRKNK